MFCVANPTPQLPLKVKTRKVTPLRSILCRQAAHLRVGRFSAAAVLIIELPIQIVRYYIFKLSI